MRSAGKQRCGCAQGLCFTASIAFSRETRRRDKTRKYIARFTRGAQKAGRRIPFTELDFLLQVVAHNGRAQFKMQTKFYVRSCPNLFGAQFCVYAHNFFVHRFLLTNEFFR